MSPEIPNRYVDHSEAPSRSTKYAEDRAKEWASLKDSLNGNFPKPEVLNWKEGVTNPYTVKAEDTEGLLKILQGNMPTESKLTDPNYLKLAYSTLFSAVNIPTKAGEKIRDVNILETGDQIDLVNGLVSVKRRADSLYADFTNAPLYSNIAAPEAQPEESPTEESHVAIDIEQIDTKIKTLLERKDSEGQLVFKDLLDDPVSWRDDYLNLQPETGAETEPFQIDKETGHVIFAKKFAVNQVVSISADPAAQLELRDALNEKYRAEKGIRETAVAENIQSSPKTQAPRAIPGRLA